MTKVGIMGGTFNPIHIAHLILAESAYEQLNLEKIIFMPSKKPPHKLNDAIASNEDRLNMVSLAIKDNPHFELSCLELNRDGITYTSDTLRELTASNPECEYYFILGEDSLFHMEQWFETEVIFQLSNIVVASRGGDIIDKLTKQIDHLSQKYNGKIHLLNTPNMEISSQMIRENRKRGKSNRYYIPDSVCQYILDHKLYLDI